MIMICGKNTKNYVKQFLDKRVLKGWYKMAGLVLEGGTLRPIFSCGVMDALLDNDIMFPYIIGVSAGITDAFSYVSKQKERNLKV